MSRILFFALSVLLSVSAYGKTISELLSTYYELDEATYVNMLNQPDISNAVNTLDDEKSKVLKSLQKFDVIYVGSSVDMLDSLANCLKTDVGMIQIYNKQNDTKVVSSGLRGLIEQMLPLFDDISAYALKSGDFFTDFVYIIHTASNTNPSNLGIIVYVQGKLTDEQLKFAMPQIDYNYDFSLPDE